MKFNVYFKCPDAVYNACIEAANKSVNALCEEGHIEEDEKELIIENRIEKLSEFTRKWITFGEYVTIEFDTEAGTATVKEKRN